MKTAKTLFAIGMTVVCLSTRVEAEALEGDNIPSLERIIHPTVEPQETLPIPGISEAQNGQPSVEPNPLPGVQQADPDDRDLLQDGGWIPELMRQEKDGTW